MPQRPDRVQRQWRIPGAVPVVGAVVVCAGLLAVVATSGGDDTPPATTTTAAPSSSTASSSTTTEPPPEPIDLAALTAEPFAVDPPGSYRIVYDVEENALRREETWTVRRPYESLVVGSRGGVVVDGTATSITDLYRYFSDREAWFVIQPERHRAAFDHHPLTAMATMVALGLAEETGEGEFVGRPCAVFVTGSPLGSGSVSPPGDERTEVCIDDAGLVLHERWEIGGDIVSERTATSVETDPAIDPAVFDPVPVIEDAPELEALVGASIAVAADQETIDALRTDIAIPERYTLDATVFRASTSDAGSTGAAETVRFYADGADLIELVEVTVGGPAELDGGGARPVEIDGFEEVWFDADFRASAIRARLTDSSFVEIRGTDPRQLVELLQSISLR